MELVGKTLEDEEHLVLLGVSPFDKVRVRVRVWVQVTLTLALTLAFTRCTGPRNWTRVST